MPKMDPAMLKQINAAVDATLKKNKDIKAASDIEKNIDTYMKKNKEAMANARTIQQLEKRVKELERKIALMDSTHNAMSKHVDRNHDRIEGLSKDLAKLESRSRG